MPASPQLLKLPVGLLSTGDPVEANPFPEGDPRHKVWHAATRSAEEELHRLNSRLMQLRVTSASEYHAWMLALVPEKFDIWARRGIHVVWSDSAVRDYDRWLFDYANSWLESVGKTCPDRVRAEDLLVELRVPLIERMEYWKAEARRYLVEQKAHIAGLTDAENVFRTAAVVSDPGERRELETAGTGQDHVDALGVEGEDGGTDAGAEQERQEQAPPRNIPASSSDKKDNHARVDAYIAAVLEATRRKISRKDMWQRAGYDEKTEFMRWQRNDPRLTRGAAVKFERVLALPPSAWSTNRRRD